MAAPLIGVLVEEASKALGITAAAALTWLASEQGRNWAVNNFGPAVTEAILNGARNVQRVSRVFDGSHGVASSSGGRSSSTVESDATRVARPEVVRPIRRKGTSTGGYALKDMLAKKAATPTFIGSRVMTAEASDTKTGARDSTGTAPLDSAGIAARAAAEAEARVRAELKHREDSLANRSSWEKLKDLFKGKKKPDKKTETKGNGDKGKSLWLNLKRTAWGTENNHWTDMYLLGNVGRTYLYYRYGPYAGGWVAGKIGHWFDEAPEGFADGWNAANPGDSILTPMKPGIPRDTTIVDVTTIPTDTVKARPTLGAVTTSNTDSINKGWYTNQ